MKNIARVTALILMMGFAIQLKAHENLDRVVNKMFKSSVPTDQFKSDGKDKKLPIITWRITISDKVWVDEFLAAFKTDLPSANFYMDDTKNGQDNLTTAIFNKGGYSYMYSFFFANESNGYVIYSKYYDEKTPKRDVQGFVKGSLMSDIDRLDRFNMAFSLDKGVGKPFYSMSEDSLLLSIPYRIEIKGKAIITDGDSFITATGISFGSKDKEPIKTDKKVTILIPKGDFIFINFEKCTAEEAREKGLNVVTF